MTFDLLTWISIGIIYSSRTIYLPSLKLRLGQSVLEFSIDKNGKHITDQKDILREIENFYTTLYSNHDDMLDTVDLNNIVEKERVNILSDEMAQTLEGKLTYQEALSALKNMKNDKSPGTDGFTAEFFEFFWKDVGAFLIRAINNSFDEGELSITQKQGIISILPKGDKPREYLKNWRPISLLNVTYKTISSCIANRIKQVLGFLIHENQKGFLKNRFIGENTRIIYDTLHAAKQNNIPGMLLLIDFEKAFDSVSWNFMHKTLQFFNFGNDMKTWIKLLYNGAQLCVIQNGIFSKFFYIGRGCRQGDPVSPYIFNLCVEIMGMMIRQNKDIQGIRIGREKICLLQYADDTAIFLDGTEKSLKSALDLLFQFSKYSGLKPNYDKTKAIWIGSKINSQEILWNDKGIQWTNDPFNILGIIFTSDLNNIEELNYNDKINKVEKEITSWSKRNLTIFGKITVIKSLLIPKLTHLFMALPKPHCLKRLENILFNFLWKGNKDRVARKTMIQDYEYGGCRMIQIESFIKALKLTWVRRIIKSESQWKNLFLELTKSDPILFLQAGIDYYKKCENSTKNLFWKEVLKTLIDFVSEFKTNNIAGILSTPIWYNPSIKIGNKSVFYKNFMTMVFT